MNTTHDNSSMETTHLQEGGVWGRAAEGGSVSPPFFHENNTAAMNTTYETLVQSRPEWTAGLVQSEASLVQSEASLVQSEAGLVQSEASLVQSGEENTFAYMMQTSISHMIRMKEYHEVCACGASCINTYGSIMCKAILNKAIEEYHTLVKSKEIATQHTRPMAPWEKEDTNPVPWRWENRTTVSPQERGKCLLYLPVTYRQAFDQHPLNKLPYDPITFRQHVFNQHTIEQHMSLQTPFCLLRENDVVDNGTVMCLHASENECIYGNETMKAMLKFERLYQPKIASETSWVIVFVCVVMIFMGAFTHKPK